MLGVEIEVTPAGKSTRKLSLLSGGEKSLVALAFVFAVFLARPCPFYILDEVEAALDDANIDRFLQLIRRFSDRAQFVIVTHQKRTMDAADVLYGVTMGGDGVTKVVSRRLPREVERGRPRRGEARRPSPGSALSGASRQPGARPEAWRASARDDSRCRLARCPPLAGDLRSRRARRRGAEAEPESEERRRGVFGRLRESLSKSRQALVEEISASLFDRIDEETWERLEEALILADAGAPTTAEVVERLEREVESGAVSRRRRGGARAPDRDPRRGRLQRPRRRSTSAASPPCC